MTRERPGLALQRYGFVPAEDFPYNICKKCLGCLAPDPENHPKCYPCDCQPEDDAA